MAMHTVTRPTSTPRPIAPAHPWIFAGFIVVDIL
jgi:hypothetical protein